jgi:hypothetical protein
MDSAGPCEICGNVGTSLYTCAICGKRVCRTCFLAEKSVCVRCAGGSRFAPLKHKGKSSY